MHLPRLFIHVLCLFPLLLAGCGPTSGALAPLDLTIEPSPVSPADTATPTPEPTLTSTPTEQPSATPTPPPSSTPTPAGTLDPLRRAPMTLMLHRSNSTFDSVKFLKGMLVILKGLDFHVITFEDISKNPDITALEQGRLFIISIDDISLQAEIDPSIQEMITMLREAGYPAVLGVVTVGEGVNENTAQTLRDLVGEGWEIAMHTDTHTNLAELEKISPYGARIEIRNCRIKIFQQTGISPQTLVLPYGAMVNDLKILYRENVTWVVGISGGEKYRTSNNVYYVGREGPDGNPKLTFQIMMERFNKQ